MDIKFEYDKYKDVWCLLNKGKSSNNSPSPTKIYQKLVESVGEEPNEQATAKFIENYFEMHDVDTKLLIKKYTDEWSLVSEKYHETAQKIFNTVLPDNITAYLTINNRNPYNISANYFYVSAPRKSVRKTIMHELWHFYTWYGLGPEQENILGKQKYNEVKESLTVLLNVLYSDLLPEGVTDEGYPQHQEMRKEILHLWNKHNDIHKVWNSIIAASKESFSLRTKLGEIVSDKNEENWWRPELFIKNTLPDLPEEIEIIETVPAEDKNYNCFLHVLGLQNEKNFTGNIGWDFSKNLGPVFDDMILNDLLQPTKNPSSGDLIVYRTDDGVISHVGLMESEDIVMSKWSWGPLLRHKTFDVPDHYGNRIEFYRIPKAAVNYVRGLSESSRNQTNSPSP